MAVTTPTTSEIILQLWPFVIFNFGIMGRNSAVCWPALGREYKGRPFARQLPCTENISPRTQRLMTFPAGTPTVTHHLNRPPLQGPRPSLAALPRKYSRLCRIPLCHASQSISPNETNTMLQSPYHFYVVSSSVRLAVMVCCLLIFRPNKRRNPRTETFMREVQKHISKSQAWPPATHRRPTWWPDGTGIKPEIRSMALYMNGPGSNIIMVTTVASNT